jgi:hypothetical protein
MKRHSCNSSMLCDWRNGRCVRNNTIGR